MMMNSFGSLVRRYREELEMGLREFADLVGMQASNLSAIEHDQRPVVGFESLSKLASNLGLQEYTKKWDEFMLAARQAGKPPADVSNCFEREVVISLLRTIERKQPDEATIRRLQKLIDSEVKVNTHGLG